MGRSRELNSNLPSCTLLLIVISIHALRFTCDLFGVRGPLHTNIDLVFPWIPGCAGMRLFLRLPRFEERLLMRRDCSGRLYSLLLQLLVDSVICGVLE